MRGESKRLRASDLTRAILVVACLLLAVPANAQRANATPCVNGLANCFFAGDRTAVSPADTSESMPMMRSPSSVVNLYVRTLHGGPLAHHWIEVESSSGPVTVGFGPATLPFH